MNRIICLFIAFFIVIYPILATSREQTKFTVVPFRGKDKELSFQLAELLMCDLGKSGKIKLVDRLHFNNILDELAKKEMSLVKNEEMIDFGSAEGADKIISGSYTINGKKITLTAWVADTKSSVVEMSDSVEGENKDIFYFLHQLANRLHYKITGGIWVPEAMSVPVTPTAIPEYINPCPEKTDPYLNLKNNNINWDNNINLSIDKGELSTYFQGDNMKISFKSEKDCFMTIYSIDAGGKVYLVYPTLSWFEINKEILENLAGKISPEKLEKLKYIEYSSGLKQNLTEAFKKAGLNDKDINIILREAFTMTYYVKGDQTYSIPPKDALWDYIMEGTAGLESLIAIGSQKPIVYPDKDGLLEFKFMPQINSSPNDFIEKKLIPELNLTSDNKWSLKIIKYYLSEDRKN